MSDFLERGKHSPAELPIPGGWSEDTVLLGSRIVSLLRPANPDEFLEHLHTLSAWQQEADPYWARLWPTALTMAQFVVAHSWPSGQPVLELGCGVGVVGIAALLAGLRVTFSDYIPIAVNLALENARRNGLQDASACVFDWRRPLATRFPIILASDVLYDPDLHEPLLGCLDRMLWSGGTCWIGDPGRYHVASFVNLARQRGYATTLRDTSGSERDRPTAGEFQLLTLRSDPTSSRSLEYSQGH